MSKIKHVQAPIEIVVIVGLIIFFAIGEFIPGDFWRVFLVGAIGFILGYISRKG